MPAVSPIAMAPRGGRRRGLIRPGHEPGARLSPEGQFGQLHEKGKPLDNKIAACILRRTSPEALCLGHFLGYLWSSQDRRIYR